MNLSVYKCLVCFLKRDHQLCSVELIVLISVVYASVQGEQKIMFSFQGSLWVDYVCIYLFIFCGSTVVKAVKLYLCS